MKRRTKAPRPGNLRTRAQDFIVQNPESLQNIPVDDIQLLVEELHTHQIELEMQNEELVRARAEAEMLLRLYTDLYDFAPVGYFTLARDGVIHQVNQTGAKLLGAEHGKLIKRRFGLFVSVEFRPAFSAFLDKVFSKSGCKETCEVTLSKGGPDPLWVDIEAITVDEQECRAVAVDVTERIIAEERVKISEEFFRELTENSSDIIFIVNKTGTITYASPSVERYLEYKPEELIGQSSLKLIHPADIPRSILDFRKAIQSRDHLISNSFRVLHKDGSEHILEGFGKNLLEHPVINGFIMNIRDITERLSAEKAGKRAEEALRESEEKYRSLVESSEDPVYLADTDLKYLHANRSFLSRYGKSLNEVLGKRYSDFHSPESTAEFSRKIAAVIESGKPQAYEHVSLWDKRFFLRTLSPVINPETEEVSAVTVFSKDITERKHAEEALQKTHERYRQALSQIKAVPYLRYYADDKYNYIGNEIFNYTGYSAREFIPPLWNQLRKNVIMLGDGAGLSFEEAGRRARAGQLTKWVADYEISTASGESRWINDTAVQITDTGGKVIGALGVLQDITEHKKAEQAFRESEGKLRAIFENMEAACCLDEIIYKNGKAIDYRILDVNPSYEKITGIKKEKAIGSLASQLYGTGEAPFLDICLKVAETGQSASFEAYFAPIGKHLQITSSCPGKGRFSNVFSDITEQKKKEEALKISKKVLQKLRERLQTVVDEERTRIAREIHDDVGQSLTGLSMDLALLQRELDKPDAKSVTSLIGAKLNEMNAAVTSLVGRVREIATQLRLEVLDDLGLSAAIRWKIREFKERTSIKFRFNSNPGDITLAQKQNSFLFRIFTEAITNIVRHAEAQNVEITLELKAHSLIFQIVDDGKGINKQAMESTKSLGIYSMREYAETIGARFKIGSQLRKGTSVTVELPLEGKDHD